MLAADVQDANSRLAFPVLMPRFGEPKAVYTSPDSSPQEDRVVWLVFEDLDGSPFWVSEALVGPDWMDNYDAAVTRCQDDPSMCPDSKWSVILVRDDQRALLVEAADVTLITWREGDLEIRVSGPPEMFTGEDAVAAANDL